MFGLWRPVTERQWLTCVWLAPALIGIPFGLYGGLRGLSDGFEGDLFLVPALFAVYAGTACAIVITLLRLGAGAAGWIESRADAATLH